MLHARLPRPKSSHLHFEKDTMVGGVMIKAYTPILINILGLHLDRSVWQRATEHLPDRFDPSHPLSKTLSGEKRSNFSWLPFNGGKRICFGKTFAELAIKMTMTMLSQSFDFSFVEDGKYANDRLPSIIVGQSHFPPIPMYLTKRAVPAEK